MFDEIETIRKYLLDYPQGLTQTDLSRDLHINRVSLSKYLSTMVARGELDCRSIGPAKLYTLTKRLPLENILSETSDYVIITDSNGRVTQIDERTAALFNLLPGLMIGRPLGEGSKCQFFATDGSLLSTRQMAEPGSRECMLCDGEHITNYNQKTLPVVLTNGTPGSVFIFTDITARKKAEEAMRESERKFRLIADTIDGVFWMADVEIGKMFYISPGFERIWGRSRESLYENPRSFIDAIHPEDRERVLADLEAEKSGQPFDHEYRINRPGGDIRHIWDRGFPIIDEKEESLRFAGLAIDITERKLAEEDLRYNQERYKTISETTSDFVFSCIRPDGGTYSIDWIAGAVERITGYTTGELYAMGCWRCLVHPEDIPDFDENITNLPAGTSRTCILRINTKAGMIKWLEVTTTHLPVKDSTSVHHIYGSCRDITKRTIAEDALKESEDKYRSIFDSYPDLYYMTDMNGIITRLSPSLTKLSGWTPGELIGHTAIELYPFPEERAGLMETLRCKGVVQDYEVTLLHRDGRHLITSVSGHLVYDNAGKPCAVEGTIHDITERKRAEEALRLSGMKFQRLVEATPDMIWEIDPQGNFTYISPQCTTQIGYTPEELIGKSMFSMVKPESVPSIRNQFLLHIRNKQSFNLVEVPAYHRNGDAIVIEIRSVLIANDQGEIIGFQGIARNITERKWAEGALREANRKLNLLAGITRHDINNQVLALNGFLALLQKKVPDPDLVPFFNRISGASGRISRMIQFTKDYEEIGFHAPAWQDCHTLVEKMAKEIQFGNITIKNNLPPGAEVFADPLIGRVFFNLMDNAAQYGGKITTIRFSAEEHQDNRILVCEDDGVGVAAEEKEKIFLRGFGKNTGMGLFLSREILDITGITIHETGEPGNGARFELTVPAGMWRTVGDGT